MNSTPLLTLGQLAVLLARRPETIRKDLKRNPGAVPPRLSVPGVRQLRWRQEDVEQWLQRHSSSVQVEAKIK